MWRYPPTPGCFAYGNVTPQTHAVAAALMRTGIDYQTVNKVFFRTKSRKRMQLEAAMLSGCEFYDGGRVAILTVPISLMERLEASETDAEDLSALGPQIQGVDCAITLRELRPDVWKMSLRTGQPRQRHGRCCPAGRRRTCGSRRLHRGGPSGGGQAQNFGGRGPGGAGLLPNLIPHSTPP